MVISHEKSVQFSEEGYLHLKAFVDPVECQRLILRMRDLTERKCGTQKLAIFEAGEDRQSVDDFFLASATNISFFFDKNAETADNRHTNFEKLNKVGHALHTLCPVYKKFSHQEKFYGLMGALGQQKPLVVQSMFIFKQSNFGDAVPPHQDATFLYTEPNSVIGVWFALEDADEENGCLWVLPKGHEEGLKTKFVKRRGQLGFQSNRRMDWRRKRFIPMPAKAGDAIVLHGLLPHFSETNRSNRTRFAYTLHFIDQKCHYPKTNWLDFNA